MGGHLEYGGGAASVAPFFFYGFLMRTRGVEAEGEGKGASGRQDRSCASKRHRIGVCTSFPVEV
jgi:hypothetical protein